MTGVCTTTRGIGTRNSGIAETNALGSFCAEEAGRDVCGCVGSGAVGAEGVEEAFCDNSDEAICDKRDGGRGDFEGDGLGANELV